MMKKKLLIIGASGHGKVVADIAIQMNKWGNIRFLDDNEAVKDCMGLKVVGKVNDSYGYKDEADFIVAIGDNLIREKVQTDLEEKGLSIATLIHPNATIGRDVKIEVGTVVMAGVVINSSTKIGKGCIINTAYSIDHDNVIEDYVHISPGANLAGTIKVGKKSWIGIGAVIIQGITIGENTTIGAGSVAIQDLSGDCIAIGCPARIQRLKESKRGL